MPNVVSMDQGLPAECSLNCPLRLPWLPPLGPQQRVTTGQHRFARKDLTASADLLLRPVQMAAIERSSRSPMVAPRAAGVHGESAGEVCVGFVILASGKRNLTKNVQGKRVVGIGGENFYRAFHRFF